MAAEGPPARAPAPPPEYRLMAADPRPKTTTRATKLRVVKKREDRKPQGPLAARFPLGSCTKQPAGVIGVVLFSGSMAMLSHAVLCCAVLCCAVLCCAVLCRAAAGLVLLCLSRSDGNERRRDVCQMHDLGGHSHMIHRLCQQKPHS